tara:strand:+ start:93 stop:341 length:249 start_codon:yes stop_codon:yes gene_type:complete
MAIKTITIKDSHVAEMIDVFGQNYQTEVLDVDGETLIPNPQSKQAFASDMFDNDIKVYIHRRVKMYRERLSLEATDTTEITE